MKIYLTPPQPSRGLQRIADALVKYRPADVEVAEHIGGADTVILYAIGRQDALNALAKAIHKSRFQRYAVIQVCLRSTQRPTCHGWLPLWNHAQVVWSWLDLHRIMAEDGCMPTSMNFYHAPLGVEADVFYDTGFGRDDSYARRANGYVVATSGLSRLSESVRECEIAADIVSRYMFHLGPEVSGEPHVNCLTDITDEALRCIYSTCEFVSALRRKEGFELPAAEGLLCGARPIAFDTPDYRWIYKSWAEYVYEGTRQEVVDQLIQLFRQGAQPVTQDEINEARQWFHWPTIVGGFYEGIRQS